MPDYASEMHFWKHELGRKTPDMHRRLSPNMWNDMLDGRIKGLAATLPHGSWFADVGSGPLSLIAGVGLYGHHLLMIDPLLGQYMAAMAELGIDYNSVYAQSNAIIIAIEGEKMEENEDVGKLPRCDVVFMCNALDHSEDPPKVFHNLVELLRPGGHLFLQSYENEAEKGSYEGLHQHNLFMHPVDGSLWWRNRSEARELRDDRLELVQRSAHVIDAEVDAWRAGQRTLDYYWRRKEGS